MSDTDSLTVYSDYICPFCYLGKSSLENYRETRDGPLDVEWHAYDLRGNKREEDGSIDHDADDGKDDAYFEQVRENVRKLAERYDAEMSLDFAREVDSWNAQQAALYVRRTHNDGTFRAFHDAVFDALWQDGRDIDDPDVLADVAEGVGIDPDEVRSAIADETLKTELRERFDDAQEVGVSAVPTFVYEEDGRPLAAQGAVPPAQLRRLVEGSEPNV